VGASIGRVFSVFSLCTLCFDEICGRRDLLLDRDYSELALLPTNFDFVGSRTWSSSTSGIISFSETSLFAIATTSVLALSGKSG
jgi:hypothetical protein